MAPLGKNEQKPRLSSKSTVSSLNQQWTGDSLKNIEIESLGPEQLRSFIEYKMSLLEHYNGLLEKRKQKKSQKNKSLDAK